MKKKNLSGKFFVPRFIKNSLKKILALNFCEKKTNSSLSVYKIYIIGREEKYCVQSF